MSQDIRDIIKRMMVMMIINIYRTYCVLGSKHLGISSDPHVTPLGQALLLTPFYR